MSKLNNRIVKHKEEIRAEIAKGYAPGAVGKVLDIDPRTIKKALKVWEEEDAKEALEAAQAAVESSLQK